MYGLQQRYARETTKKVRQIRTDLDMWEDSLSDWLRSPAVNTAEERISGTSSLHLAFLAVKMLVSRVELTVSKPPSSAASAPCPIILTFKCRK